MAPVGVISRLIRRKTKVIAITDNVIPHEKRIGDHQLTSFLLNNVMDLCIFLNLFYQI